MRITTICRGGKPHERNNNNNYDMTKDMKEIRIGISMEGAYKLNTGIGEFENSIGSRLAQRAPMLHEKYGIRLCFIVKKGHEGSFGNGVDYCVINHNLRSLANKRLLRPIFKRWLPQFDLLHWTNQFFKFRTPLAPLQLITVHDVNFMHNEIGTLHRMKKMRVTRRRLAQATHLSFISQFTSLDVQNYFEPGVPSRVIYNGVTNLNTRPQEEFDKVIAEMHLPEHYMLHISRWSRKKNVHLLIEMMQHLPHRHLVIAGSAGKPFADYLHHLVEKLRLTNVHFVGRVSTEQKAALMSRCDALLFPSRSEGFGLPVVEAMCFGKPSFITRLTSLPEVGGNDAYYFGSFDPKDMALTVEEGLADFAKDPEAWAERLKARAATFCWDKAVDEYIAYYLDILGIKH